MGCKGRLYFGLICQRIIIFLLLSHLSLFALGLQRISLILSLSSCIVLDSPKMHYYISKVIQGDFDQTIEMVTQGLKSIGFGLVSVINVSATLKEKINDDFKPYIILGACNPHFASKALRIEDKLGVLLPCNVVIIDQGKGRIEVAAMEPLEMIAAMGNEELTALAGEVSARMKGFIESL